MADLPSILRRVRRIGPLRKVGAPLYRSYRRITASGATPPIYINSIPKAGTHLVSSVLDQVSGLSFSGEVLVHDFVATERSPYEGRMPVYDRSKLERAMRRLPAGTYANCHLYYDRFTATLLSAPTVGAVFIIRDPRDILISQLHYIEQFPGHERHRFLMSEYSTASERLTALIAGWPPQRGVRGMADVGERLRAFSGWMSVLPTFRFEEFAAAPSEDHLTASLERLRRAVGVPDSVGNDILRRGIGNRWSPTMNAGTVHAWRDYFDNEHARLFDSLASDEMAQFGY